MCTKNILKIASSILSILICLLDIYILIKKNEFFLGILLFVTMWNSVFYDIKTPVDYEYYHLFHGNNIYNEVQYFEFRNDTMFIKTKKVLKPNKTTYITENKYEFDIISDLIYKEYFYYKMMYGFKFYK